MRTHRPEPTGLRVQSRCIAERSVQRPMQLLMQYMKVKLDVQQRRMLKRTLNCEAAILALLLFSDDWLLHGACLNSEKDAKLAQELGQLQPCIAVFPRNMWANLHLLGQPNTILSCSCRAWPRGGTVSTTSRRKRGSRAAQPKTHAIAATYSSGRLWCDPRFLG